jgi:(p)ppGpp synthase/HD superfamily hydrolase
MHSDWTPDEYIRAYLFAANAHLDQKVKDSELPYMVHVSLVSMEIIAALRVEPVHDGDLAVKCALLHDVIEDAKIKTDRLTQEFGKRVADGVSALTKNKKLDDNLQMKDSLKRIQEQPREVWMVKMADRITNLQPPPSSWTTEKIQGYKEEAMEIHAALNSASQYLASRLQNKIKTYPTR